MKSIEGLRLDGERALYGESSLSVKGCRFEGEADGESALKECKDIEVESSYFDLRYPFWHDKGVRISGCEMTESCRAALWYSQDVVLVDTQMHGVKALRECKDVTVHGCDIRSTEFGWSVRGLHMENTRAEGEYFLLRAERIFLKGVTFTGKYSFQYVKGAVIDGCEMNTKDAFWHAENVTVTDSVLKGEYLGWYSKNLTLVRCKISGTQPLCYCENLRLIDCEMENTDLAFEMSDVRARIVSHVNSIKNPRRGKITVPSVGNIVMDEKWAKGRIVSLK